MICPKCGRAIPDGTVCPCSLGRPLLSTNPAVNAIKTVGSSRLFLVAAILFTVSTVVSFVSTLTLSSTMIYGILDEILYRLPAEVSKEFADVFQVGFDSSLVSGAASGLVGSGLLAAAMWIHYGTCRSMASGNINTAGLTIWKIFTVISLVAMYIGVAAMLVGSALIVLFGLSSSSGTADFAVFVVVGVIYLAFLVIVCVFGICGATAKLRLIKRAKNMSATGVPDVKVSRFLIFLYWFTGIVDGLAGLGSLVLMPFAGIGTLCGAVCTILIAICISDYRKEMSALAYQPVPPMYAQPIPGYPMNGPSTPYGNMPQQPEQND